MQLSFINPKRSFIMKAMIVLLVASLGIGGISYFSGTSSSSSDVEIIYKQKKGVAYFYAPKTGEVLFLEHIPSMKVEYTAGQTISYDLSNGEIVFNGSNGKLKQSFSVKSASSGVLGIGLRKVSPGNYNDDDIFARDCGCFNAANPPTVDNRPAVCSNNNPTLSSSCGSGSSASAGVSVLGNGGNGGGGSECTVTCNSNAYACCIDKGKFDEDRP